MRVIINNPVRSFLGYELTGLISNTFTDVVRILFFGIALSIGRSNPKKRTGPAGRKGL